VKASPEIQKFGLAPSSDDCCQIIEVSGVHYEGVPTVSRYLHFDAVCDNDWPVNPGNCIPGETFIGADPQNIPWAEVSCCAETSDLDTLHCTSDSSVEQKVSWTVVRMEHEGCEWESPRFYSPSYYTGSEEEEPECPSGQSMCGGVCCDPSDCSDGYCS